MTEITQVQIRDLKVSKQHNSLLVVIPKTVVRQKGLVPGDVIPLYQDIHGRLIIDPNIKLNEAVDFDELESEKETA